MDYSIGQRLSKWYDLITDFAWFTFQSHVYYFVSNFVGAESGVFQNQTEKFEDYLYSCSRYADLFVKSSTSASLLLVEDYPNIFLLKPEIFHDVLG